MIVHRPLPVDADVTDVRLTGRRIAGGPRLSVDVTIPPAAPEPTSPTGVVAAVDTGWRLMDDGSLGVAVWTPHGRADPTPDFPHHLADAIHRHPDGAPRCASPLSWLDEWDRLARLQQRRDKNLDRARHRLLHWLDTRPDLDHQQAGKWRSAQRLAPAARTAVDRLGGDPRHLEGWRHTVRRLWERHAHTSDQLTAPPTDLCRGGLPSKRPAAATRR